MLILISPAKSLNLDSKNSLKNFTTPHFSSEATFLADQLKKLSAKDLEKLMDISPKLAELNHQRFQDFSPKFDFSNSKQALLAFDGDVYKPINSAEFSAEDFDFAQNSLRILSGFYGILKPLDLIQPYRLEMGTNLKVGDAKNLYQFWGDKVSKYLNSEPAEEIINLASEEYFQAIDQKKISAKIINVIFKEKKGDSYKIVGINAKKARGMMTRFIIKNRINKPAALRKFSVENYSFSEKLSDENNFYFLKN